MHTLISIGYSPWSWRARAALELSGVRHARREYVPTLGEPALRWKLGRWSGPVTVPVLLPDGEAAIGDSFDIAVWADRRGGRRILPEGQEAEVRRWSDVGDRAASAGRALTTRRVLADPATLRESLPGWVAALGPLGMVLGRDAAGRLLRKYGGLQGGALHRQRWTEELESIRAALGKRPWLLGRFTYADVAASIALSFVLPAERTPIGPLARVAWTDGALMESFPDLLDWRDRVLAEVDRVKVAG